MNSRNMSPSDRSRRWINSTWQNWWLLPILYLGLGAVILVAQAVDGNYASGLGWFAVFAAIAAVYGWGGRYQIIRQARGDYADEREGLISNRAMAATGTALVFVLTACIVFQIARGNNPRPYSDLMAVGGGTYLLSLLIGRYRG